jgi:hypothetical protein
LSDEVAQTENEDQRFIRALIGAKDFVSVFLDFANYLDGRGDVRGEFIRVWVEMRETPYSEFDYARILELSLRYQELALRIENRWLRAVAAACEWIDEALAEKLARVFLRSTEGRKEDRQWLGPVNRRGNSDTWKIRYWTHPPDAPTCNPRHHKRDLLVNKITGAVELKRLGPQEMGNQTLRRVRRRRKRPSE